MRSGYAGSARLFQLHKQDPTAEERARIESLLNGYSRYVRDQFTSFLQSTRDPAVLDRVAAAIRDGRIADAHAIVDSYVVRMGDALVSRIPTVGQQEAEALASQEGLSTTGVAISFNSTSPEVEMAQQRNRLQFIVQMTQDQRMTVNQALTQGAREGQGPEEIARSIRDSIGLSSYQQQMVTNYRRALESNNRDALERALRDRRYDRGFENAIENDVILPADRIDTMVGRYRERLLQLRGETIARTEAGRIVEQTRNISAYQAADKAGVPYSFVVKQWMATSDSRTRDTHSQMSGQARLLEDAFDSPSGAYLMHPHDSDAPAAEVINCRCSVAHHFFTSQEEVNEFLRENGQGRYDSL